MRTPEVAAITTIQAVLDGLPSQDSRRFVVKAIAELEQINECHTYQFGGEPHQSVARVP